MKVTFLGHAAVLITGEKTILIDPFLIDNPSASLKPEDLPKIDVVLVTHDHFDHLGQAVEIANQHKATLIGIHELVTSKLVVDAGIENVGMNIGGTYMHGNIKFSMTPAVHSANLGSPCGFVITIDEKRIYHAGDTALFSDMRLIPHLFGAIDLALLPIGGHYVMDIVQAGEAINLLMPKKVIPIHYNTWPLIAADPQKLASLCQPDQVEILRPGNEYSF